MVTKVNLQRRKLLIGSVAAGVAAGAAAATVRDGELGAPPQTVRGSVPWKEGAADSPPGVSGSGYVYFTPTEVEFIEAAVARLIPHDDVGPGAVEANVPFFLDRQLAGPFGRGDHYYLGGPWAKGTPEQGYQSRFTPAQLYRAAIIAVDQYVAANLGAAAFAKLAAADQDKALKGLESGEIKLDGGVDSKVLLQHASAKHQGRLFLGSDLRRQQGHGCLEDDRLPGAHYNYKDWVSRHGERVPFPPVGFKGRPGWTEA